MVPIIVLTLRTGGLKLNSASPLLPVALLNGIMFVLATLKAETLPAQSWCCNESQTLATGKNGQTQHGDASKKHFIRDASCGPYVVILKQ